MPASDPSGGAGGPLVSIVVNNHNYARYLPAAVESALGQTHGRVEVVVVDDGSTDDSRAVIASYGDRVRPVLKPNGGQASALNAGFAAARGDLVLFLDADDMLEPEAAAESAAAWHPGVAKVQFPLRVIDDAGRLTGTIHPGHALSSGDLRRAVVRDGRYGSAPTSGNVFPRSVLERIMPIPEDEWRRYPDTYLILLSALRGGVKALPRPLGRYREHGGNAWALARLEAGRLREHLEVDEKVRRLLRERLAREGHPLPDRWPRPTPNHFQSRLGSLRVDPAAHPYPEDRAWRLAIRGMGRSLTYGVFPLRKRLAFAAWFPLAAGLPRRAAIPLIEMGFVRDARPRLLRRFGR